MKDILRFFSSYFLLEAYNLILFLCYIDSSRRPIANFGFYLFYLKLQLSHFELMLSYLSIFFFFLPSELNLMFFHPFYFFEVNRVALLGKVSLGLGQLFSEMSYLVLSC